MKNAFSLVELSIVLVILGLLVGGILAGQSLIRASELRSIGTDLTRYTTAIYSFRDKYFALPGDINNATAFWGKDNTNCPGDTGINATPGTCNGNSDGSIAQYTEGFRFWQHLASAGLIEGSYTGTAISNNAVLGGNIPRGKMSNVGYQIWNELLSANGWTGSGSGSISAGFRTGAWADSTPDRITNGVLPCEDSWNLDTKLDDGKPGMGTWLLHYSLSSACISNTDRTSATYLLSSPTGRALVDYQYNK